MTVGFAGLGLMGAELARHLLAAHGELKVWNRDLAKVEALIAIGVEMAESPKALAEACDTIHLSLLDTHAVTAVAKGPDGLLEAFGRPGATIIDHSTISVPETRDLADAARRSGWDWVDAPVSGGSAGAKVGQLTVFIGGAPDAAERAATACAPFARQVSIMGLSGAGQATKAANQLIVGGTFLLLAEAAVLAESNGVETARLPDVLAGGFADSTLLRTQLPRMVQSGGAVQGTAAVMLKDLDLVADLAKSSGTRTELTELAHAIWTAHVDSGFGHRDWTAIIERVRTASRETPLQGGGFA
ncbi:MAG: NAD(P)-dependent oxidoreductase [Pseudomonadota bacterium]